MFQNLMQNIVKDDSSFWNLQEMCLLGMSLETHSIFA